MRMYGAMTRRFVQTEARKGTPKWVLPAGLTTCYGWEYPCLKHTLTVSPPYPFIGRHTLHLVKAK